MFVSRDSFIGVIAFMDVRDAYELFLTGEIVEDPFTTAPDLEYVIYDEEIDYIWRMVVLPIDAVGTDLSLDATPGCTQEDEDVRFESIRQWMSVKGVVASLADCPPIARMTDEHGLDLIDGRHRLALAHQYGLKEVRMMIGTAPGWAPSCDPAPAL
jgi:hypothetical protein